MKCWMCRGYGFVLSRTNEVAGCEEYEDCPECFGTGIEEEPRRRFEMCGDFYIQRENDGSLIEKPLKINGSVSVQKRELNAFNFENWLLLKMDVLDFTISADGIMFMGTEHLNDGRTIYQELWFLPKR